MKRSKIYMIIAIIVAFIVHVEVALNAYLLVINYSHYGTLIENIAVLPSAKRAWRLNLRYHDKNYEKEQKGIIQVDDIIFYQDKADGTYGHEITLDELKEQGAKIESCENSAHKFLVNDDIVVSVYGEDNKVEIEKINNVQAHYINIHGVKKNYDVYDFLKLFGVSYTNTAEGDVGSYGVEGLTHGLNLFKSVDSFAQSKYDDELFIWEWFLPYGDVDVTVKFDGDKIQSITLEEIYDL